MAVITKEPALKIVKKLEAEVRERQGKAHDLALVYHKGRLVAQFGIRRGSKKELGHDHIPSQIHVRTSQARAILAEKGLL